MLVYSKAFVLKTTSSKIKFETAKQKFKDSLNTIHKSADASSTLKRFVGVLSTKKITREMQQSLERNPIIVGKVVYLGSTKNRTQRPATTISIATADTTTFLSATTTAAGRRTPSSQQAEQKDDVDSDDQVCLQPDTRKLLLKLAYYFEGGELEKLDKLLHINKETMDEILDSSQTTFGGMLDAEAGKMLRNHGEIKDKTDLLTYYSHEYNILYLRLILSHIVSDISSSMSHRLKRCLGRNGFDGLITNTLKCFDLDRQELDRDTEAVMDGIIEVYHEEGIIEAKTKLCDVKKKLLASCPRSNSLIAIEALEYIVSHIESWKKPGKLSEADYYARFTSQILICLHRQPPFPILPKSGLFEVVFQGIDIKMTSGETTSTSTKAIRTYNESLFGHTSKNGVFGRKIDGIIGYQDLELCLCEYKPLSVSSSTLLKQQVKNLRSNSCVYHHLQALSPESDDLYIYGTDWHGGDGTMYVMKNFDDVLVATNVGKMVIPDDPMELDCIKSTISLLFGLKKHLLSLTRKYRPLHRAKKRQLEDLDNDEDPSGFTTPPNMHSQSDSPLIFFSPMKRRLSERASSSS
ncbi:hypothetical protein [Absidia glauca]|uniref:Uncharacterized protein n=1 Tax=Absidia glauca TaxID=4829 RepID=A0A163JYX6_ABSGL|nr:hypothetical protein [Absidia glauca]